MTSDRAPELDDELATWFESIGGRSVAIGTTVEDVEGRYGRWFADRGVAAVLERPDFAIYGTVDPDQDPTTLVTRLRSQLEALVASPVVS